MLVSAVVALHYMAWSCLEQRNTMVLPAQDVGHISVMRVHMLAGSVPQVAQSDKTLIADKSAKTMTAPSLGERAVHLRAYRAKRDVSVRLDISEPKPPAVAPPSVSMDSEQPETSDADFLPPPLYAARMPEPARLGYVAERGSQRVGKAVLDWQLDGDRYNLSLRLQADAEIDAPLILQTSTGQVDTHGLRPERYVDSRLRRGTRAVTLQCDVGSVSYSASTRRHACIAGMQDNLSWWVQLSAIVSAMPHLPKAGLELSVAVARTHGSVDLWTFEVIGLQDLQMSSDINAIMPAIKLVRSTDHTHRAYDTYAEVWLDAAPPHWPLRVRLQEARGEPLTWSRVAATYVN